MRVGIIGLGDMGIGMAANMVKAGIVLQGYDLRDDRNHILEELGGRPLPSAAEVAEGVDAIFLMVMNGDQIKSILFEHNVLNSLKAGASIVVTATIAPHEIEDVDKMIQDSGKKVYLVDSPVSGGKSGADSGGLTLMQAANPKALEACAAVFDTISKKRYIVGIKPGMGQKMKAALQTIIGSSFTAIFEGLALGAKAGLSGDIMYDIIGKIK